MMDDLRAVLVTRIQTMPDAELVEVATLLISRDRGSVVLEPRHTAIAYAAPSHVRIEGKRVIPLKGRKKERPSAPITKVLRGIGRGFKADIFGYLQDKLHYPVPKDPDEVTRWMDRSLSRYSDRIREWPDGSYSLLDYELPTPAKPD